ncbi:Replication origin-binding protein [uncultured Caudovirales phage]|uniref:Replication origin-binding protein n=1 Tax=uncultured Caudovirales phage TaxID=2100421 RepID=A0A6J5L0B2_9CAUD|nr:Replication origin-binding protein [uncultured Caudovirales phage]
MYRFKFAIIKSSNPTFLSKSYGFVDGALKKLETGSGRLIEGYVKTKEIPPNNLASFLDCFGPMYAATWGIPIFGDGKVLTASQVAKDPTAGYARTKENWKWNDGPSLACLDFDAKVGKFLGLDACIQEITEILKRPVPMFARPSGSSNIFYNGIQQKGVGGIRILLGVANGNEIPGILEKISDAYWNRGLGEVFISVSGACIPRCPIDLAVGQPSRLDFIGGAVLTSDGLEQRLPNWKSFNLESELLSLRELYSIPSSDHLKRIAISQKHIVESSMMIKFERAEKTVDAAIAQLPVSEQLAAKENKKEIVKQHIRQIESSILPDTIELFFKDHPERITVKDVLSNPNLFHHKSCKDPLEPEYHNGQYLARYDAVTNKIHTFAHGGKYYTLREEAKEIKWPRSKNFSKELSLLARFPSDKNAHALYDRWAHELINTDDYDSFVRFLKQYAYKPFPEITQITGLAKMCTGTQVISKDSLVSEVLTNHDKIVVISAPHGSGKTELIRELVEYSQSSDSSLLSITYRQTLAKDLSVRLQIEHYKDIQTTRRKDEREISKRGLCTVINSLGNDDVRSWIHSREKKPFIHIDEVSKVLNVIFNPNGTIKDRGEEIAEHLRYVLSNSRGIIVTDADMNELTLTLLKELAGRDSVVYTKPYEYPLPVVHIGTNSQVLNKLHEAFSRGERVWVGSDSALKAITLFKYIEENFPNRKGILIHSKRGYNESDDVEVDGFLANINERCVKYDFVVHSPKIESGVSLTTRHFQSHFFFTKGTLSAPEINQMIRRDRTASTIYIGIDLKAQRDFIVDENILLAKYLIASSCHTQIASYGVTSDSISFMINPSMHQKLVCKVEATCNQYRNEYGRVLVDLLVSRGYVVKSLMTSFKTILECAQNGLDIQKENGLLYDELRRIRNEEVTREYTENLLGAEDIDDERYKKLDTKSRLTNAEGNQTVRFELRRAVNKTEGEDLCEHDVKVFAEGKLNQWKLNMELLQTDCSELITIDELKPLTEKQHHKARQDAYRDLFESLRLSLKDGSGKITSQLLTDYFTKISDRRDFYDAIGFIEKTKSASIKSLQGVFESIGLHLTRLTERVDGKLKRYYVIDLEENLSKHGKMKNPGWTYMKSLMPKNSEYDYETAKEISENTKVNKTSETAGYSIYDGDHDLLLEFFNSAYHHPEGLSLIQIGSVGMTKIYTRPEWVEAANNMIFGF